MASDKKTSMVALNTLNAACVHKKFASFKDLSPGEYIVDKFAIVHTMFGDRIRIDLQDTYMYLPESILKTVTIADIAELNKTPKIMIYGGKDVDNHNKLILSFSEVAYFDNQLLNLITPNYASQN